MFERTQNFVDTILLFFPASVFLDSTSAFTLDSRKWQFLVSSQSAYILDTTRNHQYTRQFALDKLYNPEYHTIRNKQGKTKTIIKFVQYLLIDTEI